VNSRFAAMFAVNEHGDDSVFDGFRIAAGHEDFLAGFCGWARLRLLADTGGLESKARQIPIR
jgi:hypothetical protein